jgi:hypothetical protein
MASRTTFDVSAGMDAVFLASLRLLLCWFVVLGFFVGQLPVTYFFVLIVTYFVGQL